MRGAPRRGISPRGGVGLRRLARVCWNLRVLGLFLLGPIVGVILAGGIFGLAPALYWAAGLVFVFTLSMYVPLVVGEWRRVADGGEPPCRSM